MSKKLSCVVLCCDSHISKGNSVLNCLDSLTKQDLDHMDYEIILVENSHDKSKIADLYSKVAETNRLVGFDFIKVINLPESISRAEARNIGASFSTKDILLFIDDDTIILDSDALSKIRGYSEIYDHGYGAIRLWTNGEWFQDNYPSLTPNNYDALKSNCSLPEEQYLARTFIGSFGFCNKASFEEVGGFYPFKEYGFEDDALMFFLYRRNRNVKIIDDICVAHVNHPLNRGESPNHDLYCNMLIDSGVYWFHTLYLMYGTNSEVIEDLKSIHYDGRILDCFKEYLECHPLDLHPEESLKLSFWKSTYQYGLLDFTRRIKLLTESTDIDSFIKSSESDYDNIAPLISVAVKHGMADLDDKGNIKGKYKSDRKEGNDLPGHLSVLPKQEFNQFPCDSDSRNRRVKLIRDRYPYVDYLRIGFIGDDDLTSAALAEDRWVHPVVVEKDARISAQIKQLNPRATIYTSDIKDIELDTTNKVETFFTDPPYTLDGALGFIAGGLSITGFDGTTDKEFYVVMNPTMMGKRLHDVFNKLSQHGVYLADVEKNFSSYKLPKDFDERSRASSHLESLDTSSDSLTYSSSSNLYIFKTRNPNIKGLLEYVRWERIYEHYDI